MPHDAVQRPTTTNYPTPGKNAVGAKLGRFKSRQPAREWALMNRLPTLLLLIERNEPGDWLAIEYAYVHRDWNDRELDAIHNAMESSVHAEAYYRDYC